MSQREEELGIKTEILVWILVGSLALAIIIVGIVYNLWRRTRAGEKSIELASNYGSDDDEDYDENDDHDSDQGDTKIDQGDSDKEHEEPDEKDELKSGNLV